MRQMVADGTQLSNGRIEPTRKRNGCKCKWKIRRFYSKGAFLVLIWNLLVSLTCLSLFVLQASYVSSIWTSKYYWLLFIPGLILIVVIPLSGWLADSKFGNYRVSKFALVILFLGAVTNCVLTLIFEAFSTDNVFRYISPCIAVTLISAGGCIYSISSLQLGLDQMPDASAVSITSFIAWFVFSIMAGFWISELYRRVSTNCTQSITSSFAQIWCLFVTLCMSIVLISDFLLAPKWLTTEPESPQSLKTIYQVLKFAVKHKAPINRSALTYWEEDIPSRIDLGKSRYGGPFTTEQVEDVKTILRLLLISLSMLIIALSLTVQPSYSEAHIINDIFPGLTVCTTKILYSFTYDGWWCVIIGTLLFEFVVYPLVRNRLPSTLKRIGIASFLITTVSFLCLILEVLYYFCAHESALQWIATFLFWLMHGLLILVLTTSMLEFVCAQSPYNMRGLLAGYMVFVTGTALLLGRMFSIIILEYCHNYSLVVILSTKTVLSLIGFTLHCILARWYKRRVRDDIYSPHRVVEEVYDRYLTAQNSTSRHSNRNI